LSRAASRQLRVIRKKAAQHYTIVCAQCGSVGLQPVAIAHHLYLICVEIMDGAFIFLAYLFMAEQQHISDMFVDRHKAFLARVLPQAYQEFDVSLHRFLGPT
jgi:hypothetical protein